MTSELKEDKKPDLSVMGTQSEMSQQPLQVHFLSQPGCRATETPGTRVPPGRAEDRSHDGLGPQLSGQETRDAHPAGLLRR